MAESCAHAWTVGVFLQEILIDPPGIIFNAVCVVCFAQILLNMDSQSSDKKSNMYKFLLVKAVCDLILHSGDIIDMLNFYCGTNCNMHTVAWFWHYWNIFSWDCEFVLMCMSPLMDIAATFDCYLFITMKMKFFLTNKAFYTITSCSAVLSVLANQEYFYGLSVISYLKPKSSINETVENATTIVTENYTYYVYVFNEFGQTQIFYGLTLATSIFRDLFLVIVIIILNILILIEIKKATKRRIALTHRIDLKETRNTVPEAVSFQMSESVMKALKAEKQKAKMIFLSGLNFAIGHLAWLIFSLCNTFIPYFSNSSAYGCVDLVADFFLYVSYATPFFFYYYFNMQFKKFANRNLKLAFYPLHIACKMVLPERDGNLENTA